jgi:hypothetical protein
MVTADHLLRTCTPEELAASNVGPVLSVDDIEDAFFVDPESQRDPMSGLTRRPCCSDGEHIIGHELGPAVERAPTCRSVGLPLSVTSLRSHVGKVVDDRAQSEVVGPNTPGGITLMHDEGRSWSRAGGKLKTDTVRLSVFAELTIPLAIHGPYPDPAGCPHMRHGRPILVDSLPECVANRKSPGRHPGIDERIEVDHDPLYHVGEPP